MKQQIFLLVLFILLCINANAQTDTIVPKVATDTQTSSILISNSPPEQIATTGARARDFGLMSSYEFYLSLFVLIFGLVMIILEILLIARNPMSAEVMIKFIVVTVIITATLFLITAGYDNDQIAPAVGLFGTVAGYLLGRSNSQNQNEKS